MPGAKKNQATAKSTAPPSAKKAATVTVVPKKTATKKKETTFVPAEEDVVIEVCTKETCEEPIHEEETPVQEEEEIVAEEEVEEETVAEEEEEEIVAEEELEEYEEEEEVDDEEVPDLEDRQPTVPITSVMSPRAKSASLGNRVTSPRKADIKSPIRAAPRNKSNYYAHYGDLPVDALLYGEDDIMGQVFDDYIDVRAADVITHLKVLDRCPYYFKADGVVCPAEDADTAVAVQVSDEIEEGFELFECIAGILAFIPVDDLDFGGDDEDTVTLRRVDGHVYIVPILSSGKNGGHIRFVEDFAIWGLMEQEKYEALKTRKDYRLKVKQAELIAITDADDL